MYLINCTLIFYDILRGKFKLKCYIKGIKNRKKFPIGLSRVQWIKNEKLFFIISSLLHELLLLLSMENVFLGLSLDLSYSLLIGQKRDVIFLAGT